MTPLNSMILEITKWLNDNQGVVSLLTFLATILIAWTTGVFSALKQRPKLRLELLDGPSFCSTFLTGKKHEGHDTHRTGIAIYLKVSNVGSAPTSIDSAELGYRWHVRPFTSAWIRYRVRRFWLTKPSVAIEDFRVAIGENVKFYPFMFQRSTMSGASSDSYLRVGQSVNGVIYFEQHESWGDCFPTSRRQRTKVRVSILDAFGNRHKKTFSIPVLSLEDARKFNPSFGSTLVNLESDQ